MKQYLNPARMLCLCLTAFALVGCSHPAPPPPAAPPPDGVQTRNMSPDDAVKAHMQQNGGNNK